METFVLLAAEEPGGLIETLVRSPMLPLVIIGVMFYMILLKPERQKRAEMQRMLEALKKNDRVVTIGGIHGVVVSTDKDEVVIRVDEDTNTRLVVSRSAIARVKTSDKSGDKSDNS